MSRVLFYTKKDCPLCDKVQELLDGLSSEYDFTLTWDIFENLEYKFVAAYLDAGDYWKLGNESAEVEDTYSLYNSITLSF